MEIPRVTIPKTYKIYVNGKFPRTESGRYYKLLSNKDELIANICRCSAKDIKNAVVSARDAQNTWQSRSAYNHGQILYRIAETLEGRSKQFIDTLVSQGVTEKSATREVANAVDTFIYYAGWCDKYQQIFSSVNPVQSSHFNFSMVEPAGVVAAIPPDDSGLLGLVLVVAPIIAGGNTLTIIANEKYPLSAVELAEVFSASDLPPGVVNVLTGYNSELLKTLSSHMDVNAVVYASQHKDEIVEIRKNASLNIKRVVQWKFGNMNNSSSKSPYKILDLQEVKTTWHPVGS